MIVNVLQYNVIVDNSSSEISPLFEFNIHIISLFYLNIAITKSLYKPQIGYKTVN